MGNPSFGSFMITVFTLLRKSCINDDLNLTEDLLHKLFIHCFVRDPLQEHKQESPVFIFVPLNFIH